MDCIRLRINGKPYSVGDDVESTLTLLDFIRKRAMLVGTKYMCLEAGCGACTVSVIKTPGAAPAAVTACMVPILSCHNWEITTIEKVGNRLDGYHPIQKTLAKHNGTQCGYCSPGWVMTMYSLLKSKKDLTMLEIEKSFSGNICRCTGYRPILDAFKSFAKDAPNLLDIDDIEDLRICKKDGSPCSKNSCQSDGDWCVISGQDVENSSVTEIVLRDGKYWYRVQYLEDVFDILNEKGDDSYMLVFGNTAKGVYPVDEYPTILIDINNVAELKGYKIDQNLIIGAGSTLAELLDIFKKISQAESSFSYLKVLHEYLAQIATVAVTNMGSIGGNLMIKHQHPEFSSDIYLILATVGAKITILHTGKYREIVSLEQFLKVNMRSKVIFNVILPPLNDDYKIVTYSVKPRAQNARAIVNAGFLYKYKTSDNIVLHSRIVLGGLSPVFARARYTENFLLGKYLFLNETLQSALGVLEHEIIAEENLPEPSAAYRKQLALSLFYKSLLFLSPASNVNPKLRSGAIDLNKSRPVSRGQRTYESKPVLYPLTQPMPRMDALILCAGEASYTDDMPSCSEELHAALVLSTVPSGKIVSIDPSEALNQPGAIAFYSAKDIPGINSFVAPDYAYTEINEEVFSSGDVKYFNQPVGVVVAKTNSIAEKMAKMVIVKYSSITKPVIDVKIAKEDPKRNRLFSQIDAKDKGNDIHKIIKGSITTSGQSHYPLENIAVLSKPTEEGVEIFATSQWLDLLQLMVSRALNIPQNRVDVYVRRLGGGFGLKISRTVLSAVACSLATFKLNKPCRLVMPLNHINRAFGKRFPFTGTYDLAVNSKGSIQHMDLSLYHDNGFDINEQLQLLAVRDFNNCYDGTRWNYTNVSVMTDTAKNTWFRGPGHTENIATVEGLMEHISYELSLDPIDVRLANLSPDTASDIIEMANTLKESSRYDERKVEVLKFNEQNRWKKRGIGTCFIRWINDFVRNFDVLLSVLHGDGSVVISHGGVEMGQGINPKAIQICSYLLKVPIDKIQIKPRNSTSAPNAALTGGSLTTQYISMGVRQCCLELLRRLEPVRSQMTNPTWEELIKRAFEMDVDLHTKQYLGQNFVLDYPLFGMTIVEVEVDILTGEKQILRLDILQDVGQSPNPELDCGQVEGAFTQGMGYWLTENLVYDPNSGELLTDRTWNYKVPQALDIPQDIRITLRKNSYSKELTLGSKCIGEPPFCMAVALTHAIKRALTSARSDSGILTPWFEIEGKYTPENIHMAAATKISDLKF